MKRLWLALALALITFPAAAVADGSPSTAAVPAGPPGMTTAQRQAMFKTLQTFWGKEKQLHQQLRSAILGALSPAHRTAVASAIGELAISTTPDRAAAAKQIDAVLSPSETQSILTAHTSFATQSRKLHEAMRAEMRSEMPARPPGSAPGPMDGSMGSHDGMGAHDHMSVANADAGTVLLMILTHPEPMGMGMGMAMGHHFGMTPDGPPPQP